MDTNEAQRLGREVESLEARLQKREAALDDLNHQIDQLKRQHENDWRKYEEAVPRQDRKAMRKHGARLEKRKEQLATVRQRRKQLAGECDQIERTLIEKRKAYRNACLLAFFEALPENEPGQNRADFESLSEHEREQFWEGMKMLGANRS